MCEPVTLAALGTAASALATPAGALAVSGASAVAGHLATRQAAKASDAAVRDGLDAQYAGLQEQRSRQNQAASDQMSERAKQAQRDLGTLNAIFADSGVSGASQDRIANEVSAAALADQATLERNRQNGINQSVVQGAAIRAGAQSALNQTRRPSFIGTGLQIASAAIDYKARTTKTN